jgi:quinol monooxygenase YgiN
MIVLMGYLHLDPAHVAAFMADVQAVGADTRAEPGCLFYGIAVDDAPAGRMLLAQRWQDQAALGAHLDAPATKAFRARWTDKLTMDIQEYAVSTPRSMLV